MANNSLEAGRAALATALARAGRRASTAAVIAAAVPLATLATTQPAEATAVCQVCDAGSNVTTGSGGVFLYNYHFSSTTASPQVLFMQIPEVHSGEFLHGSGGFFGSIPTGWTVTEVGTGGATFKAPNSGITPAAFLDIQYVGGEGASFFGSGSSFNMTLESNIGGFIAANVIGNFSEGSFTIDPPSPNPAVPEPASLALLGTAIAGAAGLARRRKR